MWDSQGSVLPLLGDFTCAHKVHYHSTLMTPRRLSQAPGLCGQVVHTILHECPSPNYLKSRMFHPEAVILSLSQTSLSYEISHSGVNIPIHSISQAKSMASTPLLLLSHHQHVALFCELHSILFIAWSPAVAPEWSPSF